MKTILRFCVLSFGLLFSIATIAQESTISGKVTSAEDGSSLPGVNVVVKGTTTGTVTDFDGNYKLSIADGKAQLVFSFIGMVTQEITVGSQTTIDVSLVSDATQLSEVVVVGYGTQTKESITGSVAVVGSADLAQRPTASFEQSLQGTMAGVQATSIDGSPGGNTQIRIRGIGSITASSEPLYVIDGIPIQSGDISRLNGNGERSNNVMSGINPNDIESITVLKDASSTAIYGSRGANGVILITTKSGKSGKARIDFRSLVGFNSVASNSYMQPLNADQYTTLFLEGYTNRGDTPAQAQTNFDNRFTQLIDPSTGERTNTNWLDAITRTGVTKSYDLSASGGTDKMKYFFSGAYYDQTSHIIGTDFKRYSMRANLEFAANDFITISNRVNVSNTNQNGMVDGSAWANPMYNAMLLSPLIPIKDDQGRYNAEHKNYYPMGGNNPAGALGGDDLRETFQLRFIDNFAVSAKITENLNFRSQWSFDIIQIDEGQYKNARYGDGRNIGGYAQWATTLDKNWVGTQTLNYGVTLGGNHNIEAMIGYEAQKSNRRRLYGFGQQFPNDKLQNLASTAAAQETSSDKSEYAFSSMFINANYDYKTKYFLSASLRRDGSSRFGANNRWGNFYSVGASWLLSNEDFLSGVSMIDNLKIRASYGITGNAAIGNFPSVGLYAYGRDYDGSPGGAPNQIGNPDLTWESQENFNFGLDFSLLKRVNGTLEYFKRTSSDLILDVPISKTTGFSNLTQNFGEMENSGFEITLSGDIINTNDLVWSVGFNTSILTNVITKLQEDFNDPDDGTKRRQEGSDFQSYYLIDWAGVDQTNGLPQYYTDSTRSEITNNVNEASRFMVGKSATPDHYGGLNTSVRYKGISLDAQFGYSSGNYIYDPNGRHVMGDGRLTPRSTTVWGFENRWVPGKTDALLPMHQWGGQSGSGTNNNSRWLYDATYLRLRNITLAYNLPSSIVERIQMRSVRVYVRGNNLLTFTKDKDLYLDPEQAVNGVSNWLTPAIKTFSIGVDIGL